MILLDTGPVVAVANKNDDSHQACSQYLATVSGPLVMPAPVLTEVCYLLETRGGADLSADFLADLADGVMELVDLQREDLRRMEQLVRTYADLPLGAVDASVVAVSERLGITEVATLDRRHFSVVRPRHAPCFSIVP